MLRFGTFFPLCGTPKLTGNEATTVLRIASLFTAVLRSSSQGNRNGAGRGAGFRDFLCLPSAKENRSNRWTFPGFSSRINDVDPSNYGGVGKNRGRLQPAFSLIRISSRLCGDVSGNKSLRPLQSQRKSDGRPTFALRAPGVLRGILHHTIRTMTRLLQPGAVNYRCDRLTSKQPIRY